LPEARGFRALAKSLEIHRIESVLLSGKITFNYLRGHHGKKYEKMKK
jgi:hypothetical protein